MAPTYKLTYFTARAWAEPARFAFSYAGVPFEDVRFEHSDEKWKTMKTSLECPWGMLPVLEVDGKVLAQSGAILRYLGKQFNLAGENDWEEAKCDEMIEAMLDLRHASLKFWTETNEEKKAEMRANLLKETFPKFLTKWSEILKENNGFLVGKKLSIADFCIASCLEVWDDSFEHEVIKGYPAIVAHKELVFNAPGIKEWVAKRPKTQW